MDRWVMEWWRDGWNDRWTDGREVESEQTSKLGGVDEGAQARIPGRRNAWAPSPQGRLPSLFHLPQTNSSVILPRPKY